MRRNACTSMKRACAALVTLAVAAGCGSGMAEDPPDPPDAASDEFEIADMRVETVQRYPCPLNNSTAGTCADFDVWVRIWNGAELARSRLRGGDITFQGLPSSTAMLSECAEEPWIFPPRTLSEWIRIRVLWIAPMMNGYARTEIQCGEFPDQWYQLLGLPWNSAPPAGTPVTVRLSISGDFTRTAPVTQ